MAAAAASTGSFTITIKAVDYASRTVAKFNQNLVNQTKGWNKLNASAGKFGKELVRMGKITGVTQLVRNVKTLGGHLVVAAQRAASFVGRLLGISSLASAAGLVALATHFSHYNQDLTQNSKMLGINAAELERWQIAGRLAGITAAEVTEGLGALGGAMQDALTGRAPMAAAAFKLLNISVQGASPYLAKTANEILPQLADAIKAIEDRGGSAAEELQLLADIHAPSQMLPLFRLGAAGMKRYLDEAERYRTRTPAASKIAERFRLAQVRLSLASGKLGLTLSEILAPAMGVIEFVGEHVIHTLTKFTDRNKEGLSTRLILGIVAAGDAYDHYLPAITAAATATDDFVTKYTSWGTVFKLVGLSVGVTLMKFIVYPIRFTLRFIGYLIKDLWILSTPLRWLARLLLLPIWKIFAGIVFGIGRAFVALFSILRLGFLLNPITLALAAIGLAAYEVWKHWDKLGPWFHDLWDTVKGYALTAWQMIQDAFPGVIQAIKDGWSAFGDWLKSFAPSDFAAAGQAVVDDAPKVWNAVWDVVKATWTALWGWIRDSGPGVLHAIFTDLIAFLTPIGKALWKPIGDEWDNVVLGISEKIDNIKANFTRLKIWFARLASQMLMPFKAAYNDMASFFNRFADTGTGRLMGLGHMDLFDTGSPQDRPFSGNEKDLSNQAMDYFTGQGWSREQAAGIVGNLRQESGYNPQSGAGTAHQGIAQWSAARQKDIEDHFGKPLMSMSYAEQLAAVHWELTQGKYKSVGNDLRRMTSTADSAAVIDHGYESPGNYGVEDATRAANAKRSLNDYPLSPIARPAAAGSLGTANVDINFRGFGDMFRTSTATTGSGLLVTPRTLGPVH